MMEPPLLRPNGNGNGPTRRQMRNFLKFGPKCFVCKSSANLMRCSNCKAAYYCSRAHQRADWLNHRANCKPYQARYHQIGPNAANGNGHGNGHHQGASTSANGSRGHQEASPANGGRGHQEASPANGQEAALPQIVFLDLPPPQPIVAGDSLPEAEEVEASAREAAEAAAIEPAAIDAAAVIDVASGVSFQEAAAQLQADREKKVQDFRNLTENTMRINDVHLSNPANVMASDLRDDLCKTIIADMNEYGLSVIDDFLGRAKGLDILNEVDNMYGAGVFRNGQLVSNSIDESNLSVNIRGDKITWVKGTEPDCINIGFLINQIDNLVISANKMRDNGSLGKYKIRERTKAMVACYPGSGAQYVMHVDNPNQDGRVITAIYYLNLDWDTQRSGGMLRIIPENGGATANIEPKFDRILFFWSDRRNPHEVQPAHQTRYAITVWYFDADEREAALQRFRQEQQSIAEGLDP